MAKDELQFEQLLADYCAPVLKKKKLANMFHIHKDHFQQIQHLIQIYNQKLNDKGLFLALFQKEQERVTIYLYQREMLSNVLSANSIQNFLNCYHYPLDNLDRTLSFLDKRLHECIAYPHEIGIFLGYPLCDVIGFIQQRPCTYCGYWKVYHNTASACRMFHIFDECCKELSSDLLQGKQIEQLVV